jgi:hypothetical protein
VGEEEVKMPTTKPGQKQYQVVLEEGSLTHTTLLEWAKARGLTPGKAARVVLTDWSDAMNGKPNPFAIAIAAAAGVGSSLPAGQPVQTTTPTQELSPEEKARQAAIEDADAQFLEM